MSKSFSSGGSKSTKSRSGGGQHPDLKAFISFTQAAPREAEKFLAKYQRLDLAVDKYFENPREFSSVGSTKQREQEHISRLNELFDRYKDPDSEEDLITPAGTIRWIEDLNKAPEDVVFLAVAYELKSPSMATWTRQGWIDGWKSLGQDTIDGMSVAIDELRAKLASDPIYFKEVYNQTFEAMKQDNQRYLMTDDAQGFWSILIPHGLSGGALSHTNEDEERDDSMDSETDEKGWQPEHLQWWFEFLDQKGPKSINQDTWKMMRVFVRSIDAKFQEHDENAFWPPIIDDFVTWVRENHPELRENENGDATMG